MNSASSSVSRRRVSRGVSIGAAGSRGPVPVMPLASASFRTVVMLRTVAGPPAAFSRRAPPTFESLVRPWQSQ